MKTQKIRNKNGDLTHYAFKCGYTQRHRSKNGSVQLFLEDSTYHVICFDNDYKPFLNRVFDVNELTLARQMFKLLKNKIK